MEIFFYFSSYQSLADLHKINNKKGLESLKTILYLQPCNAAGRYSSGQRGRTVNPLITSSQVRILLSPQTKSPKHVKSSLLQLFWTFCLGKVSPIRLTEGIPVYLYTNHLMKKEETLPQISYK